MKLWILLIKFLFIGALFLVSNNNLHLGVQEDFQTFKGLYAGWMTRLYDQGETVVGYVIKSEWVPEYVPEG